MIYILGLLALVAFAFFMIIRKDEHSRLFEYRDEDSISPLEIVKNDFELVEINTSKPVTPKLSTDDNGISCRISIFDSVWVTELWFGYEISFEYKNRKYRLSHKVQLTDDETDWRYYERYCMSTTKYEEDPVVKALDALSLWVGCKVYDEFDRRLGDGAAPIQAFGIDIMKQIGLYIKRIDYFECGEP